MSIYLIALLFFIIAALYASVGFGGGSSYIALLLILGMAIEEVRLIALICNIIVVLGSCINYYRADMIPWKKVLPIVIVSVPCAFLGGTIQLDSGLYRLLAGVTLVIAAVLIKWETAKLISVTASVFILFNSIAGIAGQLTNQIDIDTQNILILGLAVLTGGQLGNYLNIKILSPTSVRLLTAILVGVAGVRFILSNL